MGAARGALAEQLLVGKAGKEQGQVWRFFTFLIYRNTALYNLCKAEFKPNHGKAGKTINSERKPEDQVNDAAWFPCALCMDSSTAHRKIVFRSESPQDLGTSNAEERSCFISIPAEVVCERQGYFCQLQALFSVCLQTTLSPVGVNQSYFKQVLWEKVTEGALDPYGVCRAQAGSGTRERAGICNFYGCSLFGIGRKLQCAENTEILFHCFL